MSEPSRNDNVDDHVYKVEKMSLEEDLAKLMGDPSFSDMHLIFSDGKVFLHKVILLARCPKLLEVCLCRVFFCQNNCVFSFREKLRRQ